MGRVVQLLARTADGWLLVHICRMLRTTSILTHGEMRIDLVPFQPRFASVGARGRHLSCCRCCISQRTEIEKAILMVMF